MTTDYTNEIETVTEFWSRTPNNRAEWVHNSNQLGLFRYHLTTQLVVAFGSSIWGPKPKVVVQANQNQEENLDFLFNACSNAGLEVTDGLFAPDTRTVAFKGVVYSVIEDTHTFLYLGDSGLSGYRQDFLTAIGVNPVEITVGRPLKSSTVDRLIDFGLL